MHAKHSNWTCIGKHYLTIIDNMYDQHYFACSSSSLVGLNLHGKITAFYMSALDKWSYFSSMFSINSYQELLDVGLFANGNLQFNKKVITV